MFLKSLTKSIIHKRLSKDNEITESFVNNPTKDEYKNATKMIKKRLSFESIYFLYERLDKIETSQKKAEEM